MAGREKRKLRNKKGWLFLMPSLVGVCLFYVLPYGTILRYSVQDSLAGGFAGVENYKKLLHNSAFGTAMENTVWIMAAGVLTLVCFSLWLACFLEKNTQCNRIVRTCLLCPVMVPAACAVMVWKVLFESQGVLNQVIMACGGTGIAWFESSWGRVVVLVLFLWKYAGYDMIVFWGALANIPQEYIEVARLEGAREGQIFWRIKLRCISPSLFFVVLISVMNSFKLFREIYLLTGNYPNETFYLLSHFLNNTLGRMDYQKMSAAAILFSLALIVVIGVMYLLEKHAGKDLEK